MSGHCTTHVWLLALLWWAAGCPPTAGSDGHPATDAASAPENQAAAGPAWRPGWERPPVIDVHTHIMPHGLARLAQVVEDNGLGLVVNLSGGSVEQAWEVSRLMRKRFPAVVSFYNPDWKKRDLPDFGAREAAALERAVRQYGLRGLKVSKALGLYLRDAAGERIPVDWPGLDPLWRKAGDLGIPVAIHTSDPRAFWEPATPDNERYAELALHPSWSFHGPEWPSREQLLAERDRVLARHPDTTFICVHLGNNPEDLDYVDRLLDTYPNALVDTSARVGEIGRHPPAAVRAFFIKHKERVLFGTDLGLGQTGIMLGSSGEVPPTMEDVKPFYDAHWRFFEGNERGIPHPTPIQGAWPVDAIDLPDDVLHALYHGNAERVLKLQRGAAPAFAPPLPTPAPPPERPDAPATRPPGQP